MEPRRLAACRRQPMRRTLRSTRQRGHNLMLSLQEAPTEVTQGTDGLAWKEAQKYSEYALELRRENQRNRIDRPFRVLSIIIE